MSDGREKIVWKACGGGGRRCGRRGGRRRHRWLARAGGYAPRRHGQRTTKHVFITGMDLFSTSEQEKRERGPSASERMLFFRTSPWRWTRSRGSRKKKKARAARFGTEYKPKDLSGMGSADLLEQRVEADQASSSRLDTIHVYGVDLLSTKDVMQYFGEYYPQVSILHQTPSRGLARRLRLTAGKLPSSTWSGSTTPRATSCSRTRHCEAVLASLGKPLAESSGGESSSVDQLYKSMGKTWHKGKDFLKGGATPVPIIFRLATDEDVKPKGRGQSRYLWRGEFWEEAKQERGRQTVTWR